MHANWGVGGVILLYGPWHLVQGKVFGLLVAVRPRLPHAVATMLWAGDAVIC
jgi:hypothetical protein